jgi:oligosaccharide repeat unit polymerase
MAQTLLANWWHGKAAWRLDVVASLAAILIVCRLGWEEDLTWVWAFVVCAGVVTLTAIRWPYGALVVLIAASAMPFYFVQVFGWNARPEHVAAAIVCLALAVRLVVSKFTWRLDKIDYWILTYVILNFVSSALGSSDPSSTLRWALQNSLAILAYFLIRGLVRDRKTLRTTFAILLVVGLVESVFGIVCYWSHQVFGTSTGVEVGQYLGDVAVPYGSLFEPNLFGAYTACCAILFLALYLFAGHRVGYFACFVVSSLAAVLSFSRAVLLALLLVVGYVVWKNIRLRQAQIRKVAGGLVLVSALVLLLAAGSVGGVLRERFDNLSFQGLSDETTITRIIVAQQALQDVPDHLFLGSGTASFNLSFDWAKYVPSWAGEKTWIGNAPLRILHDTGLLGLTAFLGFFVAIARRFRRIQKLSKIPDAMLIGLMAGTLLYGIAFESTDGTILAFCWVHLGVLASAVILVDSSDEAGGTSALREVA